MRGEARSPYMPSLRALSTLAAAGILGASIAGACSNDAEPEIGCRRGPVKVVVTLPLFADFACRVGGERVTVDALIPWDTNPHTFQPGEEHVALVSQARLILFNGLDLEGSVRPFFVEHAPAGSQLITYARSIPSPTANQPPADQPPVTAQAAGDEAHMWLDIDLARVYIAATEDSLEIVDSDGIPTYRENAKAYLTELDALQRELEDELRPIIQQQRRLFTYHDSFRHFARRYEVEVAGSLTADPARQPTDEEVAQATLDVKDAGLRVIFRERGFDKDAIERVADGADVKVCALYSDMVDGKANTYIDMMNANAQELNRCLRF